MRITSRVFSITCVAIVILTGTSLQAVPLQTDPNGLDGGVPTLWQGTRNYFQLPPFGTGQLAADVDFAVFGPGQFGLSYPGLDPSAGANYVYAYQIHNKATPISTKNITALTVGLNGDELPSGIGFLPGTGFAPNAAVPATFIPAAPPYTSAKWTYLTSPALTPGLTSTILIFTSPYGPELANASLIGQLNNTKLLPSPVPEPASLVLLGLGGAMLLAVRRRGKVLCPA